MHDNVENLTLQKDSIQQQKSKTLTVSTSKSYSISSSRASSEKITSANRSSSNEILGKVDDKFDDGVQLRKSLKTFSRHLDLRKSMPVNKKLLKSMFRSNKDDHAPKIEASGPITCDLINPSVNDDYLLPITTQSEQSKVGFENPYDEVPDQPGDDVSHVMSVVSKERPISTDHPFHVFLA